MRFDGIGRVVRGTGRDGPAGERLLDACRDLGAIEVLARAIPFHHDEPRRLDALVRREPGAARRTLSPAADGRVIQVAGVHDPGVAFAAVGAAHGPGCLRLLTDHHRWWSRSTDYTTGRPARRAPAAGARGYLPATRRALSSAMSAGTTWNTSPTTNMSAKSRMGASGSRSMAMIVPAVWTPTLCWMAPLMPHAR